MRVVAIRSIVLDVTCAVTSATVDRVRCEGYILNDVGTRQTTVYLSSGLAAHTKAKL